MRPHILLLDEPTNHASMEMIDSMARAIKQFQGGVIVISHDFRLLQQVRARVCVPPRVYSPYRCFRSQIALSQSYVMRTALRLEPFRATPSLTTTARVI